MPPKNQMSVALVKDLQKQSLNSQASLNGNMDYKTSNITLKKKMKLDCYKLASECDALV